MAVGQYVDYDATLPFLLVAEVARVHADTSGVAFTWRHFFDCDDCAVALAERGLERARDRRARRLMSNSEASGA